MKQDEIFRFVHVRPVQAASNQAIKSKYMAYSHDPQTNMAQKVPLSRNPNVLQLAPLHQKIRSLNGHQTRAQARKLALETLQSDIDFTQISRLTGVMKEASAQPRVQDAKEIITQALGARPDQFINSAAGATLRDTLWDRYYAHALAPDAFPEERSLVINGLRSLHFIELLISQEDHERPLSWAELEKVRPTIPRDLIPRADVDADNKGNDSTNDTANGATGDTSNGTTSDTTNGTISDATNQSDPSAVTPDSWKQIQEQMQRIRQEIADIDQAIVDLKSKERMFQLESARKVPDLVNAVDREKPTELQTLRNVAISSPVIQAMSIVVDPILAQPNTPSLQLLQAEGAHLAQVPQTDRPSQTPGQTPGSTPSQTPGQTPPSGTPPSSASAMTHVPQDVLQRSSIRINLPSGLPGIIDPPKLIDGDEAVRLPLANIASVETIIVPPQTSWIFGEFGEKHLDKNTLDVVKKRSKTVVELSVPEIIENLETERLQLLNGFVKSLPTNLRNVIVKSPYFDNLLNIGEIDFKIPLPDIVFKPRQPETPMERGIRPLGIGDLLTVRQQLLRYEPGEIAHIENIMRSEHKTRTHTRTRETEEISVVELEHQEESEKDLQSTERFELQKETQKAIAEEMKFSAGLKVSGGWGPVSVSAHADFALTQSLQESQKAASTFAKQVTERAVSRIMERAREERTRRTLERFEERNEHGFDNRNSTEHAVGIYRWVDKYYKARIVNYGKRLMMEFVIPEPAAFYTHLESMKTVPNVNVGKPKPPTIWGRPLQPKDLNKSNYMDYISQYNVQDTLPYPDRTIKVAAAMAEAPGADNNVAVAKVVDKLKVPDGYYVEDIYGWYQVQGKSGYFCRITVGGEMFGNARCYGLEGVVPIGVNGYFTAFQVSLVAKCALKESALEAWQLKTYQAIMNAYERALADYNEKVAAASIQAGITIEGRNPELNRKIEMEELKKAALRMLTNDFAKTLVDGTWRYSEQFGAFYNGPYGYPEFDIKESLVEGSMIRFFEQAFEWQNMTYRFYPYFWGRKGGWPESVARTDTDPEFTDFLRAGAARVIVPVHPAYTDAVLHYLNTNEIWNGGPAPVLNDPLFISIVEELRADTDKDLDDELEMCNPDSGYPCVVDTWEIKVPTSLVIVQEGSEL